MSAPHRWWHRGRVARWVDAVATSWWLVPTTYAAAAIVLSAVVAALDQRIPQDRSAWYLFGGGPSGAREVLSTIASSMMTFTGLVFSVTVLVLQLASNQFSPRVLRTFMKDRFAQSALGVFVGTFVYALFAIRAVRGESDGIEQYVPSLTVWLAIVLAVACVAVFILLIHHIAQSIRAVVVIARIAAETRTALDRLYPEEVGAEGGVGDRRPLRGPDRILRNEDVPGVLVRVDADALLAWVARRDAVVAIVPKIGDFVPFGAPLAEVWGGDDEIGADGLASFLVLAPERTIDQDVPFGIRQIVDIALRALSPGVNDPTTATQALDALHDLLRRLAARRFPESCRLDPNGDARLFLPRPDFRDCLSLAFDEIRLAGAGSMQVSRRLEAILSDLETVAPPERRPAIEAMRTLVSAGVDRAFAEAHDRSLAASPSAQAHGPAITPSSLRSGDGSRSSVS
jgi:uncharacterized membrane protein